jgi:hypothetical protein
VCILLHTTHTIPQHDMNAARCARSFSFMRKVSDIVSASQRYVVGRAGSLGQIYTQDCMQPKLTDHQTLSPNCFCLHLSIQRCLPNTAGSRSFPTAYDQHTFRETDLNRSIPRQHFCVVISLRL